MILDMAAKSYEKMRQKGMAENQPRMDTNEPSAAFGRNHNFLDCGGKRSATPLLEATGSAESGVAAALCHRSPNLCRPCAKLQDCITNFHRLKCAEGTAEISPG
jgi:hypothetical protein